LSQLTNSFLPTAIEGKGEGFSTDGMPVSKSGGVTNPTLKKAPAAVDPKKKWMRRI
jgi:hypothetical protein